MTVIFGSKLVKPLGITIERWLSLWYINPTWPTGERTLKSLFYWDLRWPSTISNVFAQRELAEFTESFVKL